MLETNENQTIISIELKYQHCMLTGVYLVELLWCFDSGLKKKMSLDMPPTVVYRAVYMTKY